jgi:hypothetical protein
MSEPTPSERRSADFSHRVGMVDTLHVAAPVATETEMPKLDISPPRVRVLRSEAASKSSRETNACFAMGNGHSGLLCGSISLYTSCISGSGAVCENEVDTLLLRRCTAVARRDAFTVEGSVVCDDALSTEGRATSDVRIEVGWDGVGPPDVRGASSDRESDASSLSYGGHPMSARHDAALWAWLISAPSSTTNDSQGADRGARRTRTARSTVCQRKVQVESTGNTLTIRQRGIPLNQIEHSTEEKCQGSSR